MSKKISLLNSSEVGFLYCGCLYFPYLCAGNGDTLLSAPDRALTGEGGPLEGCAPVSGGCACHQLPELYENFCLTSGRCRTVEYLIMRSNGMS